jgi:hypothetical protein
MPRLSIRRSLESKDQNEKISGTVFLCSYSRYNSVISYGTRSRIIDAEAMKLEDPVI